MILAFFVLFACFALQSSCESEGLYMEYNYLFDGILTITGGRQLTHRNRVRLPDTFSPPTAMRSVLQQYSSVIPLSLRGDVLPKMNNVLYELRKNSLLCEIVRSGNGLGVGLCRQSGDNYRLYVIRTSLNLGAGWETTGYACEGDNEQYTFYGYEIVDGDRNRMCVEYDYSIQNLPKNDITIRSKISVKASGDPVRLVEYNLCPNTKKGEEIRILRYGQEYYCNYFSYSEKSDCTLYKRRVQKAGSKSETTQSLCVTSIIEENPFNVFGVRKNGENYAIIQGGSSNGAVVGSLSEARISSSRLANGTTRVYPDMDLIFLSEYTSQFGEVTTIINMKEDILKQVPCTIQYLNDKNFIVNLAINTYIIPSTSQFFTSSTLIYIEDDIQRKAFAGAPFSALASNRDSLISLAFTNRQNTTPFLSYIQKNSIQDVMIKNKENSVGALTGTLVHDDFFGYHVIGYLVSENDTFSFIEFDFDFPDVEDDDIISSLSFDEGCSVAYSRNGTTYLQSCTLEGGPTAYNAGRSSSSSLGISVSPGVIVAVIIVILVLVLIAWYFIHKFVVKKKKFEWKSFKEDIDWMVEKWQKAREMADSAKSLAGNLESAVRNGDIDAAKNAAGDLNELAEQGAEMTGDVAEALGVDQGTLDAIKQAQEIIGAVKDTTEAITDATDKISTVVDIVSDPTAVQSIADGIDTAVAIIDAGAAAADSVSKTADLIDTVRGDGTESLNDESEHNKS